jgi:hypothetical protein
MRGGRGARADKSPPRAHVVCSGLGFIGELGAIAKARRARASSDRFLSPSGVVTGPFPPQEEVRAPKSARCTATF